MPLLRWYDGGGIGRGAGHLGGDGQARLDLLACLAQPRASVVRRQSRGRCAAEPVTVPHRWERIQELFDAALELAPEARTAYVHERAEDSTLRTEVLALLEAHEARGRLDSIADRLDASSTVAAVRLPPVLSGRYSIEREIGRGGMATRSEEHTSELQSRLHLVCRLLLEKKKKNISRIQV